MNGTYAATDESASQGQSAAQTTAITTFLTAANTLSVALGELSNVQLTMTHLGTKGKIAGL